MRRRRRADEELLPLEIDGDDAPPDGNLVELGPGGNRRWRDGVLLLAAVGLVAVIGLTGDDGEETADAEPASTTTTRRRPVQRPPRTTTSTAPVRVPTSAPGAGPVLDGSTGSAVAFSHHDGGMAVLDLDTGDRCDVAIPDGGGVWLQRSDGVHAIAHTDQAVAVAGDCSMQPLPATDGAEVLPADEPGRYWSLEWRPGGLRVVEIDGDGVQVADPIDVPGSNGMIRVVDGGLVVDVFGSVTFIDRRTRRDRHLGHGTTIAGTRDRVALVECEGLSCDVVVRDLQGRQLGRVGGLQPTVSWEAAALSPDHRLLAVLVTHATELPWVTVVDLETGARHAVVRSQGGPVAFTADGRYVVTTTSSGLVAAPVTGGEPTLLAAGAQSFTVIQRVDRQDEPAAAGA